MIKAVSRLFLLEFFLCCSLVTMSLGQGSNAGDDAWISRNNTSIALLRGELSTRASGNACLSPLSILNVLYYSWQGASGETFTQINKATGDLESYRRDTEGYYIQPERFNSTNLLLISQKVQLTDHFRQKANSDEARRIDFTTNLETTRLKINDWVDRRTHHLIRHILPQDSLTPDMALVMVNAVYFNIQWRSPFDPGETSTRDFYAPEGTVKTLFMKDESRFDYRIGQNNCTVLQIPYRGDLLGKEPHSRSVIFTVIMPDKGVNLDQFADTLDAVKLDEIVKDASAEVDSKPVTVYLPKFTLTSPVLRLKKPLQQLGMVDMFVPDKSDFSRMAANDATLFVSEIYHRCCINVNEQGTKAAASSIADDPFGPKPSPTVIDINRPFLWFIYDRDNRNILFCGALSNPSGR